MVNKIGTLTLTSAETKYDVASDIGGFVMGVFIPGTSCQISINDNLNYVDYNAMQTYNIPGLITDVYVKGGDGTSKLQYWFFDC